MEEENLEDVFNSLEGTIFEDLAKAFNAFLVSMTIASQPSLQNEFLKIQSSFTRSVIRLNKDINLEQKSGTIKCNYNPMLNFQGIMMGIIIFEILEYSKFNKIMNQSEIFKFSKHIRNGCAHNNRFHFDKPLAKPIIWNNHKIDNDLQGKEVIPSFLWIGDIMFLARDIMKEINIRKT